MQKKTLHFLALLFISGLFQTLLGCTSQPEPTQPLSPVTSPEPSTSAAQEKVTNSTVVNSQFTELIGQDEFSTESLYSLLIAEIAGHRGRLDITLNQYLKQAEITRDPKVVARANRIARYMHAPKPILDTARLWVDVEPDSIEARQVLAQQLMVFGLHEEALIHVDTLLRLSANINIDELIKSASRLNHAERDKLIQMITQLSQKHPSNPSLLLGRGMLFEMNQQNPEALQSFAQTLKLQPDFIPALISKARLLSRLEREKEALSLLSKAVKRHPKNVRLRLVYAQQLLLTKNLKEAEDQLSAAQALSPNDEKLLFSLGMIYIKNGLSTKARPYFERLVKTGANTSNAHYYLAAIDEGTKHLNAALAHLHQVKSGRNLVGARIQIADILDQQNKTTEAINSLTKDQTTYPQFSSIFILAHSELLTNKKRYEESYQLLKQALLTYENHPQLLYRKAMVAEKLLKLDEMEEDLLNIIENDPQNASALNALGYSLADRGKRLDEALTYIARAYALAPNDPAIIDSMGWIHYRLNDLQKALDYLRKAYEVMPDQEIAAHFGEVLWISGQKEEAQTVLQEALKRNPESEIINAVMTRFQP
ncbi:MAG: tetratricopeptide repeat protein [Gammaproteobacteria bacterium]|nr:tetratricopeptide repeat protein [Gammaproteobacteria bacterium]